MITLSGGKYWRIRNVITVNSRNTYEVLNIYQLLFTTDILTISSNGNNMSSSTTQSGAAKNVVTNDSTFLGVYHSNLPSWNISYNFNDYVRIGSVFIRAGASTGDNIVSFNLEYSSDNVNWLILTKVEIDPITHSTFKGSSIQIQADNYLLDIGTYIPPRNVDVIKSYANNPLYSIVEFKTDSTRIKITGDGTARVISGSVYIDTTFADVAVYESKLKHLVATYRTYNGNYHFVELDQYKEYYVMCNGILVYDTTYEGSDVISGFVEGVSIPVIVHLVDSNHNVLSTQIATDFEFKGYNINALKGYIKVDGKFTDINMYSTMEKGYLTGSVNSDCEGTDFKIRCYREDGFFIGDYVIQENGMYEIPNLNVNSSYDILLHDNNASVETMVNSRRIPTKYQ